MGYLRDFLFRDEQARQPVATLSGGERNRLLLAKALAAPSNLLVLDEPTNDLDIDTLELLEEMLGDYAGTLLLVSHDRDFLDRLVTSTIVFEGDGTRGRICRRLQRLGCGSAARARLRPWLRPARRRSSRCARPHGRRLGYKREHALAELPKRIEALQGEIASLHQALADPDLYRRDASSFAARTARLGAAKAELEAAETEWLELELLREELNG